MHIVLETEILINIGNFCIIFMGFTIYFVAWYLHDLGQSMKSSITKGSADACSV